MNTHRVAALLRELADALEERETPTRVDRSTVAKRILERLQASDFPLDARTISASTGIAIDTVRTTLSKAVAKGSARRTERLGFYEAVR